MSVLGIVSLVLVAILGTYLLWRINEPAVRKAYSTADKLRWVFGLVFLGLAAYHLVHSGQPKQIVAAMIAFSFLTAWALVERPWDDTI